MKEITALGLFSGGLDSILACRVIMAQGIRVVALKFVTPFFDDALLRRQDEYCAGVLEKYGIDVRIVDLSDDYIELLREPRHGYGKHFNPCVDCKIFMLQRARALMDEYGASFLVTGEVLGQRPMSQRRDTLRVIERESGCEDILLRPLCAKLLGETKPEREGQVDRQKLLALSGRGRRQQMNLAAEFGVLEYPSPAGGCILTDPNLAARIQHYYQERSNPAAAALQANDIRLLLVGRQYRLPDGSWFVLGRDEDENCRLEELAGEADWLFYMPERPGPTGLLRRAGKDVAGSASEQDVIRACAGLVVRYGRKNKGRIEPGEVCLARGEERQLITAGPLADTLFADWQL